MEPFFDGGLFELLLVAGFAILVNFIFLKRYLLILFSLIIVSAPVVLYFIGKNELYNWIVTLCLFNAFLLVSILWKQKKERPGQPLFNLDNMKSKLSEFKNKINNLFSKKHNSEQNRIEV